jgi:hypothetical protein
MRKVTTLLKNPTRTMDPLHLADWLEIKALLAPDKNSSAGDLTSLLRTENVEDFQIDAEDLARDTFAELSLRIISAKDAYPFDVDGGLLKLTRNWIDCIPYTFCLLLSYLGHERGQAGIPKVAKLFEELAALAASNFLDNSLDSQYIVFGSPRKTFPPGFKAAVNELFKRIGEGRGCVEKHTRSAKDEDLDVVAWRDFPDRLAGKLLLFGQCASGADWADKKGAIDPKGFCDKWAKETVASQIVRAFFVPHRLDQSEWRNLTIDAGLVFDRCRIAFYAQESICAKTLREWCRSKLEGLRK